ncbi:thioredoxin domain-containing protein [Streptomyces sp. ITFR-6]|uniref:thioredoxin domain-containing protein n=1 Tax=Streptomyces sp. ITFR-6 TaxID=3075197 RepID=UPI00288C084F|nr:thioredoxin domain-containing protein [Streptomyces sp. ITFR-6]WNI32497.1 thioredoxin domain-containing protein [Streptomyces sp. ITFR-6]
MSEKNQEGKRAARDRLIQQREQLKARERRRRTLIVSTAVVGVLALAAVVGVIAANSGGKGSKDKASGPAVAPSGATGKDSLAIQVGADDAPSTLTIWEDFRCPVCAQFENAFRDTIHQLEQSKQLKVEYHLATLIDGNLGGSGSLQAANAAACAQDVGKFSAYHDILYRNQPQEADDAFGDNSKLIDLSKKVDGLDTPAFRSCVDDGTHDSWVQKSDKAFRDGGFQGTPTALLNGQSIFPKKDNEPITVANLKKWVAEANKGKGKGTATPAPSGS